MDGFFLFVPGGLPVMIPRLVLPSPFARWTVRPFFFLEFFYLRSVVFLPQALLAGS